MPTFRTQFSHYLPTCLWRWNRQSVPKRRHIKFRRRGITQKKTYKTLTFFISNFRLVLYVVCFLLGKYPSVWILYADVSEQFGHYLPTCLWRWNRQSVLKRRHIKFRSRGITQKKTYNIQNKAEVWNKKCKGFACFLLGNSPASEFYMPTFRNTLSVPSS